jgi:hypothetical protein
VSPAPSSPHPEPYGSGEPVGFSFTKPLKQKGERTGPRALQLASFDPLENGVNPMVVEHIREHFPKEVAFVLAFCDARLV